MTEYDFSAQQVTEKTTAEYVFPLIPGDPSVILLPAHDANVRFYDERIRLQYERSQKEEPVQIRNAPLTEDDLKRIDEEARETDRILLSRVCAVAWGTAPVAKDGTAPEFSEQQCYAFFKALPNYLFDPLRNFAANLYNFVKRPPISKAEAQTLGND